MKKEIQVKVKYTEGCNKRYTEACLKQLKRRQFENPESRELKKETA